MLSASYMFFNKFHKQTIIVPPCCSCLVLHGHRFRFIVVVCSATTRAVVKIYHNHVLVKFIKASVVNAQFKFFAKWNVNGCRLRFLVAVVLKVLEGTLRNAERNYSVWKWFNYYVGN